MKAQKYLAVLSITFIAALPLEAASVVQFAQIAPYVIAENAGSVTVAGVQLTVSGVFLVFGSAKEFYGEISRWRNS